MKLRIMSDLHVEFHNNPTDFVVSPMPDDKDTVLILAGDIHLGKHVHNVLEPLSSQFKEVIYILGNHEFYKGNMPTIAGKIDNNISHLPNVWLLDTDTIELHGVHFVGATLWTDMGNHNQMVMYDAGMIMNDYKAIRTGPRHEPWKRTLRPVETVAMHIEQRNWMFKTITELKEAGETVVAISHHLPSYQCIGMYKGDRLNGAYASELYEDIADSKPDLWIHGHTHESVDLVMPGTETRIICNPRGYWPTDLNPEFDMEFTVEI